MFLVMISLMMELHKTYMGKGNTFDFIKPELFNASLHSLQMIIIWLRFMLVLITNKRIGPFLRMMYLMFAEHTLFIIIFLALLLMSAAVFTAMFHDVSEEYTSFMVSLRTLWSAALATFNMETFGDYSTIGGALLAVYLLMSNVMLLNLIIALLSNVYSNLIQRVDSGHHAVVIDYYNRWQWHDGYGLLIFMPSPLSYLVTIFLPFYLLVERTEWVNDKLCKIFYIFFAIPQFMIFAFGSLWYGILLYFKGFRIYGHIDFEKNRISVAESIM